MQAKHGQANNTSDNQLDCVIISTHFHNMQMQVGDSSKRIKMSDPISNLPRNEGCSCSFGVHSPLDRDYSSPPPEGSTSLRNYTCSPPPPPRHRARTVSDVAPDADAMLLELNAGRSLANAKPFLFPDYGRSVRPRLMSDIDLTPVSPSYPHFPLFPLPRARGSSHEEGDDDPPFLLLPRARGKSNEEGDDDLPTMVAPIRPRMRCTGHAIGRSVFRNALPDRTPGTDVGCRTDGDLGPARCPVALRMTERFLDRSFVPVSFDHDDDLAEQNQNKGRGFVENRSKFSAFSTR